jgi:hypothetical protein
MFALSIAHAAVTAAARKCAPGQRQRLPASVTYATQDLTKSGDGGRMWRKAARTCPPLPAGQRLLPGQ